MKKFTIILAVLIAFTIKASTQTNVSGFISSNTNWTLAGSPYIITGNTILDSGYVLSIDPGVMIKFNSAKSLQINGNLRAIGNSLNKITFTSNQAAPAPGDWAYILFSNNSQDYNYALSTGSIMEYCIVEYAGQSAALLTYDGAIRIEASFPYLYNCEVRNNSTTAILFNNDPNSLSLPSSDIIKISRCFIHNNNSFYNMNATAGGIDIRLNQSQVIIDSSIIYGNKARYGGGIHISRNNNSLASKLKNNSIIGNLAQSSGGGIYMDGSVGDFSNNLIYGNSAYDGAGIYENAVTQNRTIYNNIVVNNTSTKDAVFINPLCTFIRNTIVDNTASSSIFSVNAYNNGNIINNNTITRNALTGSSPTRAVNVTSSAPTSVNFKSNNICSNKANYEVYTSILQSTPSLNFENCWWNTIASTSIDSMIYDFLDNNTLTIVDYSPFANTPDTLAPISPPINVIKTDLGGGKIKISWNANMESDRAGYKIYWNSPTGYSFANSLDAGDVTADTLTGILITDTIAVTAYDAQMDGLQDQFEGHESWFTYAIGKPTSAFTATPIPVCPGNTVFFTTNTAENYPYENTTWSWSFPGGVPDVSSAENPKVIYSSPGVYSVKLTVTNIAGINSITYDHYITVNDVSNATLSHNICNAGHYTSPSGNYTWYSSGTYHDTIPNYSGCDSILTINLRLSSSSYASISPKGCRNYVSPSGKHIWTNSGTFYDTIPNFMGCDSILSVYLTVYAIDTVIALNGKTLTSNTIGVSYQWLDCGNGYSPISGETSQSYTPAINGNYAVEITQNNCRDTSSCYHVTVVGIGNVNKNKADYIYPNPASDIIRININESFQESPTLNIYNIMGELVWTQLMIQNQQVINISNLCNGIYIVQIKSKEGVEEQKLIIQK